jgi:hypothetical protein
LPIANQRRLTGAAFLFGVADARARDLPRQSNGLRRDMAGASYRRNQEGNAVMRPDHYAAVMLALLAGGAAIIGEMAIQIVRRLL